MRDYDQRTRDGLPGDQYIQWANGSASVRQSCANLARQARILPVQFNTLELQGFNPAKIFGLFPAFEGTVIQFVHDNGGDTKIARQMLLQPGQQAGMPFIRAMTALVSSRNFT